MPTSSRRLSAHGLLVLPVLLALLAAVPLTSAASASCPPERLQRVLKTWTADCLHPLCGNALAAPLFTGDTSPQEPASPCGATGWSGLVRAIDATLAADGFVLLGEIHDNAAHHELRAALIEGADPRAAVVFEQFRADQLAALAPYSQPADPASRTLDRFLADLSWETAPWAKTADYRPLFAAALSTGRAIHAGDPGREAMYRSARDGAAALSHEEQRRLALDHPLASAHDGASLTEIEEAHCGLMPKSALAGMAYAQRFRDASLADALVGATAGTSAAPPRSTGAILIAGNGHVRSDRGVPWYLARRAQRRPVLAVVLAEANAARMDAASYVPRDPDGRPAADWLVITPKAKRDADPCAAMRAAFERKRTPAAR